MSGDLPVVVRACDMPEDMKKVGVDICAKAVAAEQSESKVATMIKKQFDALYPEIKWHCFVGRAYGSYFTHDPGTFLHVQVAKEVIILFRSS